MPRVKDSGFTVTDQFCGCGGSSSGAAAVPGVRVRMALNHWKLAIETHNTNFPDTDHDCTDVQACDPRRYPSTNILITSPECTNHSLAKGKKRKGLGQEDLFVPRAPNAEEERSRATMWDVPRFAEYHRYEYIVVENVPDATQWELYEAWIFTMQRLGYRHRALSLNSMFFWPCPQSRDRLYVVFWREGNPEPALDHMPRAWCGRCERDVDAVQTWKRNPRTRVSHTVGRYRRQYLYTCPGCRTAVEPYFFCALNALDLSLPAERIGDRARPLQPRTLDRIRFGLLKYGRQYLVLRTNMTSGVGCRVRGAGGEPMDTQPGSNISALVSPAVVETAFSRDGAARVSGGLQRLPTQSARLTHGLAIPNVIHTRQVHGTECRVKSALDPIGTQTGDADRGIALPMMVEHAFGAAGAKMVAHSLEAMRTQTTAETLSMAVPPPLTLIPAGSRETAPRGPFDATPTFTGSERLGLGLKADVPAFSSTLRGTADDQLPSTATGLAGHLGTVSAGGRHHALIIHGAALLTMRDSQGVGYLLREFTDALGTQVATCVQDCVISRGQFFASYYGTDNTSGVGGPAPTFTTLDRHGLVESAPADELDVDDCHFRMLQPHEIKAGMAFDSPYVVLGNKRQQVKQLGNAVTPPVMQWIVGRLVDALESRGGGRRVA
jgi:DNA (cytosine-5)-methyltransferase 1